MQIIRKFKLYQNIKNLQIFLKNFTLFQDSGTYTVLVKNELGQIDSSIELSVLGAETLYLDAQHPEAQERIAELDQPRIFGIQEVPDLESSNPPQFLSNLQDIEINEFEDVNFDLKVRYFGKVDMFINFS